MGEDIEDEVEMVSFTEEDALAEAEDEEEQETKSAYGNEKPVPAEEKPQLTETQRQSLLGSRKFWYNRVFAVLEIVKSLQHKELCFLTPKEETHKLKYRQLFCETYDIWQIITEKIGFQDKLVNVYNSVATFKHGSIPMSSLNPIRRADSLEYKEFNENAIDKIEDYDFLIDIDGENFVDAYNQAKQVKEVFDEFSLPYTLNNSSSEGFHFTIEGKYFPDIKLLDKTAVFSSIAKNIQAIYSLKGIDETIYDFRRVKKVPYSFNCLDRTIVLPLSDEEFNEKLKVHQAKYFISPIVLARIMIKNRGLLTRNLDKSQEELIKNCKKFVKEFK